MSVFVDRYGYLKLGWVLAVVFALAITLTATIFMGGMHLVNKPACFRQAEGLGLRADWGILTDCRVEVNGRLVDIDLIRITDQGEVLP